MPNADWTSIAGQLVQFGAPVLGGILGGPAGGAVGTLVGSALGSALGVPATPQAISAAITADPTGASTKISAVEAAHAGAMSELEAQLADIANARGQTIELAKDGSQIAWGAPVVSAIIAAGFLAITGYAVVRGVSDNPVTQMLVGTFAAAFGTVAQYWLGSSAGSHAKDTTISAAVQNIVTGAAARVGTRIRGK
jgi:hypothetical protein